MHTFKGHKAEVCLLQPFGDHVISVDTDSVLIIWHIYSEGKTLFLYLQIIYVFMYIAKNLMKTISSRGEFSHVHMNI